MANPPSSRVTASPPPCSWITVNGSALAGSHPSRVCSHQHRWIRAIYRKGMMRRCATSRCDGIPPRHEHHLGNLSRPRQPRCRRAWVAGGADRAAFSVCRNDRGDRSWHRVCQTPRCAPKSSATGRVVECNNRPLQRSGIAHGDAHRSYRWTSVRRCPRSGPRTGICRYRHRCNSILSRIDDFDPKPEAFRTNRCRRL
jgi:hypothetical protein